MTIHPKVLRLVQRALPGIDMSSISMEAGEFHDVVLWPGRAVVKVARGASVLHLQRRAQLLERLSQSSLPFEVPFPLGALVADEGLAAVALSWVDGLPAPPAQVSPEILGRLLESLAAVSVDELADVLDSPHAYAGRDCWKELMLEEVVPRLPVPVQAEALERLQAAIELPAVQPSLVHGDLAGTNLRWVSDGSLKGVLDWDLAQPFDPAVDAACLGSWYGWQTLRRAVDGETFHRARIWYATFGLEQVASALSNGEPESIIEARTRWTSKWIEESRV